MNEKEINALISLLDDTDEEVLSHVKNKLLAYGRAALPFLEDRYLTEPEKTLQAKIHDIIDKIHSHGLKAELQSWAEGGGKDLFEGFFLIAKFRYPDLNKQAINNQLDKIKLDAWLELNFQLAPTDKVRILNYVFYTLYGLKGNSDDYHNPDNSFINRILETKYGNPISLAIIYSVIAQRLNIPIFGVNLPQHFVLAYKDDTLFRDNTSFKGNIYMEYNVPGEVLFYINAFNKGAVFSRFNIDQFLKQLNISPMSIYYEPCSNVDIISRVLRNLVQSYEKLNDQVHLNGVKELLDVLQPYGTIF